MQAYKKRRIKTTQTPRPTNNKKRNLIMKKTITQQLNKFFEAAALKVSSVFVCAVLSVITVICVGFSSWIIVNPNVKYTVNASPFEVYTVTDSQNYIVLSSPVGFSYYHSGFTDGKGNLTATGNISFDVGFKSGNAKAFLEATNGMNLQFTLYFTGVDESTAAGVIPSATCNIGTKNIACERIVNNGEYYLRAIAPSNEIGITESTTEKNFTVTFKLASDTYAELYKYLQKGGSFMIEARVSKIYK